MNDGTVESKSKQGYRGRPYTREGRYHATSALLDQMDNLNGCT
jgi:hypothetical protein